MSSSPHHQQKNTVATSLMFMALLVLALFAAVLPSVTQADIDVHCLASQMRGRWRFILSKPVVSNNTKNLLLRNEVTCAADQVPGDAFSSAAGAQTVEVSLEAPNLVREWPSGRLLSTLRANWTSIYDQGFEIRLNNVFIFAFNRYETQEMGGTKKLVRSFCNETLTHQAWYRDYNKGSHGCVSGHKLDSKPSDVSIHEPVNTIVQREAGSVGDLRKKRWRNERELIEHINRSQKSWKAQAYDALEDLTMEEVMSMMGGRAARFDAFSRQNEATAALSSADEDLLASNEALMRPAAAAASVDSAATARLPKNFDWRNVNGINYVSPVRNQRSCGSCYIFATLAAIESRLRIKSNNTEQPVLSPQHLVSCSMYSQKCHGGFPYLASKFISEYGVVNEECMPYEATSDVACSSLKKCSKPSYIARVREWHYVGGYHGASNELEMMKEIHKHGPISANIIVLPDLMYYKSGVYVPVLNGLVGHVRGKYRPNKWEPVTHSIALVGWGEDESDGTKYWIAKNSWGEGWGDNGFFRIKRGVDAVSIESLTAAIDPELIKIKYD